MEEKNKRVGPNKRVEWIFKVHFFEILFSFCINNILFFTLYPMYSNARLKKKRKETFLYVFLKILAKFMSRDLSSQKIILKPNKRVDPNKNM